MTTRPLPESVLRDTVEAYVANDYNQTRAARVMGLGRSTFQSRLIRASELNMIPGVAQGGMVPPGFVMKGVSTLYDAEGNVTSQWVKTKADPNRVALEASIHDAFDEYKGYAKLVPLPKGGFEKELLTVYNIADHHLGLFAWGEETGEDYDLKIGATLLLDTMTKLIQNTPRSETALVLNLGDFFHSDNNENRTLRSGNALDVDTRYAKVLQIGVELMIHCVQMALQKHKRVIVRSLPGNHDPYAALALSVAMAAFFDNEPRVEVDTSPDPFFWYRFGKVFIGAAHGDMAKPSDMPGLMAATRPLDWGASEYRYIYLGHVHHKEKGGGEKAGAVWEVFQSLAAKDAWHHAMGYSSGRSMVAITHHRNHGEVFRHTVSIAGQ